MIFSKPIQISKAQQVGLFATPHSYISKFEYTACFEIF